MSLVARGRRGARTTTATRRLGAIAVLWVVAVGYAWAMGGSRPFTVTADTETAVAFVGVIGLALATNSLVGRHHPLWSAGSSEPHANSVGDGSELVRAGAVAVPHQSIWPWVVLGAAVLVWELVCYFAGFNGHRAAFPTISSFETAFGRWQAGRAVVVVAWMALGWRLVRR